MLSTPMMMSSYSNRATEANEYYTFRLMVPSDTPKMFMDEYPWISWRVMDHEYGIPLNFEDYTDVISQHEHPLHLQYTRTLWMHSCYVMWYANIVILLVYEDDAIFDSIKRMYNYQTVYWFSLSKHEWRLYKNGIWSSTTKPSVKRFNKDPYVTTIGLVAPWGASDQEEEDNIVYQSLFSKVLC